MYLIKSEVQADLRNQVAEVIFTKLDGNIRKMRATLRPEYLPKTIEEDRVETGFEGEDNPNVVAVWDIDAKGWRSFRIDRVISIQAVTTV